MRMRERARVGLAATALVVLGVSGCDAKAPTDTASIDAGGLSVTVPAQPFDILAGDKVGFIEFAQMKIRNKCLAEAGFPQNLNAMSKQPQSRTAQLLVSAASFGPVSEDDARRHGFGHDSTGEPAKIVSFDKSYDHELDRCTTVAKQQLGSDVEDVLAGYDDLVSQLYGARREADNSLPTDLPAKLYDCMVSKGYTTDRAQFLATPSHLTYGVKYGDLERDSSQQNWKPDQRKGGVQVGPAIPPQRYVPTKEESALAVAWYQCGVETKRVELQLAACLAAQQRYVTRFEDRIAELNRQVEVAARKAATVAGA